MEEHNSDLGRFWEHSAQSMEDLKKKRRRRRIIILLSIVLVLAAAAAIFSRTQTFALWNTELRFMSIMEDPILNRYRQKDQIDDDLVLITASTYNDWSGQYCVAPLFLYKDAWGWRAAQFTDNARGMDGPYYSISGVTIYLTGTTFVQRLGDYTILHIGSVFMAAHELSAEDISDNVGTRPIRLSSSTVGIPAERASWVSYSGMAASPWLGQQMVDTDYIYVIRNMPDDYEMHCGEYVISKEYIDELYDQNIFQDHFTYRGENQ